MKTALLIALMLTGSFGSMVAYFGHKKSEYTLSSDCVKKYTSIGIERGDIIVSNGVCYLKVEGE